MLSGEFEQGRLISKHKQMVLEDIIINTNNWSFAQLYRTWDGLDGRLQEGVHTDY